MAGDVDDEVVAAVAGVDGTGAASATDGKRVPVLRGFDQPSIDSYLVKSRFDWR